MIYLIIWLHMDLFGFKNALFCQITLWISDQTKTKYFSFFLFQFGYPRKKVRNRVVPMVGGLVNNYHTDITGTMQMLHPPDKQPDPTIPEGSRGLYSLDTDGTIKKHLDNVILSNGIAWSHDNKTMYYVDSFACKLFAFDYDLENGSISKFTFLFEFWIHRLWNIASSPKTCPG